MEYLVKSGSPEKQRVGCVVVVIFDRRKPSTQAEALDERSAELLRQQIIEQLPDIVRAAAEPLAAIQNMTVISSDATGTAQIGQNLESQLATTRQIIKDLVGVDISELITGRAVGQAAGEALAGADGPAAVRRRSSRATNSGE